MKDRRSVGFSVGGNRGVPGCGCSNPAETTARCRGPSAVPSPLGSDRLPIRCSTPRLDDHAQASSWRGTGPALQGGGSTVVIKVDYLQNQLPR